MRYILALLIIGTAGMAQAQKVSVQPLQVGEVHTLHSAVLNEDRVLNIYLPPYFEKDSAYGVLYLLDGSANEDFLHIAGLMQFFTMMFSMPEMILVGVGNVDRKRDFTFHTDLEDLQRDYPTTGHSDQFIRFLAEELQPYIQATYRTNGKRFIIGQSLGGLLASEILLTRPDLFTHYFIVSPSLWWDNESLLKRAPSLLQQQDLKQKYVYIAAGKDEPVVMQRDARKLAGLLQKAAQHPDVRFVLMGGESHATILHNSIYRAWQKLFPSPY